jgi:hypothetical protein
MTATALDDARVIANGIRLGGSSEIASALAAALAEGPLTPDGIERLAHPDWDRFQFEEHSSTPVSPGAEPVGLARLYAPGEESAEGTGIPPSWAVAAAWYGWLPGLFASRDAALLAYGYVLGGEGAGPLEELRDRIVRAMRQPIDASALIAFAGHGHEVDGGPTPDR